MFIKKGVAAHGWIQPQFHWGFVKGLLPGGLKPNVNIMLGFARDYAKGEIYEAISPGEQINYSKNYFQPVINIDSENLNFYKNDSGWDIGIRGDYQLTLRLYNNEYSYLDRSVDTSAKNKTEKIKGFYDGAGYNEYTYNEHQIRLRTSAAYNEGPLALRLRLYTPVVLRNQSVTPFEEGENVAGGATNTSFARFGTLVPSISDPEYTKFTFEFNPYVELAARYRVFDNKLTINVGGRLAMGGFAWTTTESTSYKVPDGQSEATTDTRVELAHSKATYYQNQWGNFASQLRFGLMFYFSEKFAIDAASSVYNGKASLFGDGAGGMLNFTQIMAHLYF